MAPHLLESETVPEAPGKKRDVCSGGSVRFAEGNTRNKTSVATGRRWASSGLDQRATNGRGNAC